MIILKFIYLFKVRFVNKFKGWIINLCLRLFCFGCYCRICNLHCSRCRVTSTRIIRRLFLCVFFIFTDLKSGNAPGAGIVWIGSWGARVQKLVRWGVFTSRPSKISYCLGRRHGWWPPALSGFWGGSTIGCCGGSYGRCLGSEWRGHRSTPLRGTQWGWLGSRR